MITILPSVVSLLVQGMLTLSGAAPAGLAKPFSSEQALINLGRQRMKALKYLERHSACLPPRAQRRFPMPALRPNPRINYFIRTIHPNPTVDYKLHIIRPIR